jgi:hypothetical protein
VEISSVFKFISGPEIKDTGKEMFVVIMYLTSSYDRYAEEEHAISTSLTRPTENCRDTNPLVLHAFHFAMSPVYRDPSEEPIHLICK